MENLVQMFGGAATLIAVLGGAMATIFFAWAGIQWMMASGDPQKIGQARMALIGAAVGLVIVGASFIVPEVISERIIEPSGGAAIHNADGLSCDRVLRNQLVLQRSASNAERMNSVVKQIQAQRAECGAEVWAPVVVDEVAANECSKDGKIGNTDVPRGLQVTVTPVDAAVVHISRRDADNKLIVYLTPFPSDSARCWLYSARLRVWDQGY